jgi:hypothetical protein
LSEQSSCLSYDPFQKIFSCFELDHDGHAKRTPHHAGMGYHRGGKRPHRMR